MIRAYNYNFRANCKFIRENNLLDHILTNQIYNDYYSDLEIKE